MGESAIKSHIKSGKHVEHITRLKDSKACNGKINIFLPRLTSGSRGGWVPTSKNNLLKVHN